MHKQISEQMCVCFRHMGFLGLFLKPREILKFLVCSNLETRSDSPWVFLLTYWTTLLYSIKLFIESLNVMNMVLCFWQFWFLTWDKALETIISQACYSFAPAYSASSLLLVFGFFSFFFPPPWDLHSTPHSSQAEHIGIAKPHLAHIIELSIHWT